MTNRSSTPEVSRKMPLPIGKVVKPWGKIGAILLTGGERYYLLSKGRCVSMIPAFMVEAK